MQDIEDIIGFQLDENFIPIFMHGAVSEITGYEENDFLSGKVRWVDLVLTVDKNMFLENRKEILNKNFPAELEYRIESKNGKIKWVREILQKISDDSSTSGKIQGFIYNITKNKQIEKTLQKREETRIKEIHHRIKNNLQVISSLLYLQVEKFDEKECVEYSDVSKAFKECQNRVTSISLIHQELSKSKSMDNLDFAAYIKKLTTDLIDSYTVGKTGINLKLELEQVYLDMDTAIPLGIIINELISNSLKYAFPDKKPGEIFINLSKDEKGSHYMLIIADNGIGIPEDIDVENTDSLGLNLVNILVNQIDGRLEVKRNSGTEFIIEFKYI